MLYNTRRAPVTLAMCARHDHHASQKTAGHKKQQLAPSREYPSPSSHSRLPQVLVSGYCQYVVLED